MQASYPSAFRTTPPDIKLLAETMGLSVVYRENLSQRGVLELDAEGIVPGKIHIRQDLSPEMKALVLAHEIGHARLIQLRKGTSVLPLESRELFARAFATQLLIPKSARESLRNDLATATRASDLLAIAARVNIPPLPMLMLTRQDPALLGGGTRCWLRLRRMVNRATNLEEQLRIEYAFFDGASVYIAKNQRFSHFCSSSPPLSLMRPGDEQSWSARVKVHRRSTDEKRKYLRDPVDANLSAVAIRTKQSEFPCIYVLLNYGGAESV